MTTPQKIVKRHTLAFSLLSALFFAALPSQTLAVDYDRPVFEFQSKLANQGNAKAQYFLAQMYEEGRGTQANPELAKHWYEQAKLNGYDSKAQSESAY